MAQWTSIEDETGMTLVYDSPHFCFEDNKAAARTDDIDLTDAVIDGRLLKIVVADDAAKEAVGFVAMREKSALSVSDDLGYISEEADLVGDDLLDGEAALGDMDETAFTYAATWTFASHVFTRTANAANLDIVHDTAAVAGTLYKVVFTCTLTAGTLQPQIGATDGTARSSSGTYTEYIRATDTTAFTMQAVATTAGTITEMYVYAMTDQPGLTVAGSNTLGRDANGDDIITYVDDDTGAVLDINDFCGGSLETGKYYQLVLSMKKGTGDAAVVDFFNDSDEALQADIALTDSFADYTFYFHFVDGLYIQLDDMDASDVWTLEEDGHSIKEVHRIGTDALVIMDSDGEKYQWELDDDFEKNSASYTFDIYEMQGGGEGFTRLETQKVTQADPGLIDPATSRGTTMEYPNPEDMEDFD